MFTVNEKFEKKAIEHKKPLIHTKVAPKKIIKIVEDEKGFQKLNTEVVDDFNMPYTMKNGDTVILDFGRHCVGYLHYAINHKITHISDSPVMLRFSFGEFPYELMAKEEEYSGELGNGWIQREIRNIANTPYVGSLERRYAFRFVRIQRLDRSIYPFEIDITELFADCVCASSFDTARQFDIKDSVLKKIYDMSAMTLSECSQDVYEDGPKRDRRMWIGDLRLEALTDYVVFNNLDIIKRCIYLFAAYKAPHKMVAPCLYQNCPPYVDNWYFKDYSLFFISCIYDYTIHTEDLSLAMDLYEEMYNQYLLSMEVLDSDKRNTFVDWCPDLDKQVATFGIYIYVLKQFKYICEKLQKPTSDIQNNIQNLSLRMMKFYDSEKGFFITSKGQLSVHSQVWAILTGELDTQVANELLDKIGSTRFEYFAHTPYMMNCHLEALFMYGRKEEAIDIIKSFWGKMASYGFDCCLELFNDDDHFESPYKCPELNSACHAWSCTPAYWIYKYYNE